MAEEALAYAWEWWVEHPLAPARKAVQAGLNAVRRCYDLRAQSGGVRVSWTQLDLAWED